MSSYQNRRRSRPPIDRQMDKWIRTGRQVVDGVAGNRPGQRRGAWQEKTNGPNFEKVGRWMEEKIDWFFEDDEDWLDDEALDEDLVNESAINTKKPLGAISLRVPKALPPKIDQKSINHDDPNDWPDDQSFKLNQWERKDNFVRRIEKDIDESVPESPSSRRRNLPRSSRRKS